MEGAEKLSDSFPLLERLDKSVGANVSCQLKFCLFASCQVNFQAFVSLSGLEAFKPLLAHFPSNQNFRNGDKRYENVLGNFPESPEIVEFLKTESFNQTPEIARETVEWNRNSRWEISENLGIPRDASLLSKIPVNADPLTTGTVWIRGM